MMLEQSTVEILMAVRNGERFIQEQINSILKQDYTNFRLLVRDNCSDDNTCKIVELYIEKYPEKIFLIRSRENVGILGNFSHLMDYAKSDYVMFADHDDVWYPEKISSTMQKMKEMEKTFGNQTPILVHSDLKVVDMSLNTVCESFWNYANIKPIKGIGCLNRQLVQNTITGNTVLINRHLLEIAKPIPTEVIMHDWWLGLVAAAFGVIGNIDNPTILYRQHSSNDTGAKKYQFPVKVSTIKRDRALKRNLVAQAKTFLNRYHQSLSDRDKRMIEAYALFQESWPLTKMFLMIKYGFYKYGFLRNLKEILT